MKKLRPAQIKREQFHNIMCCEPEGAHGGIKRSTVSLLDELYSDVPSSVALQV